MPTRRKSWHVRVALLMTEKWKIYSSPVWCCFLNMLDTGMRRKKNYSPTGSWAGVKELVLPELLVTPNIFL
jgi:hypothetical protein